MSGERNIYTDIAENADIIFAVLDSGAVNIAYTIPQSLVDEYGEDEITFAFGEAIRLGARVLRGE